MTVFLHLESIPVDRLPKKIFKMVKPEIFFSDFRNFRPTENRLLAPAGRFSVILQE